MFRAKYAPAPTSPHAIPNISSSATQPTTHPPTTAASPSYRFITSPRPPQLFTINPVESALPQNQISHLANQIESTPFFQITQFRTNSAPATPASTTLTRHPSRNSIRINTSTKHQVAPHLHCRLNLLLFNRLHQFHHAVVIPRFTQFSESVLSPLTPLGRPSASSPAHPESPILCDSIPGKFSDHDHRSSLHPTAPPPASWHGRRRSGRLHRRGASHSRAPRRSLRTGRRRAPLRPGPQPQRC